MSPQPSGSVYGHPSLPSFSQAPRVGGTDPHIAHASGEVAMVATVASDVMDQVVDDCVDVLDNPAASPEEKAQARARLKAMVKTVQKATEATQDFASAEMANAGLLNTPIQGWAQADPGNGRTPADAFAEQAAQYFEASREKLLSAAEAMEQDPALATVLGRRSQPGGVSGFIKRVAAATVTLSALSQRALALPGLVRQSISNGLDRADTAVQDALDRWHAKLGAKVDQLRQSAVDRVTDATIAVKDRARAVGHAVDGQIDRAVDATQRGVDAVRSAAQAASEATQRGVDQVKDAAQVTADSVVALDRVVTSHVRSFWNDTVVPAFNKFSSELSEEFKQQRAARASRVNTSYAQEVGGTPPNPENLGVSPGMR